MGGLGVVGRTASWQENLTRSVKGGPTLRRCISGAAIHDVQPLLQIGQSVESFSVMIHPLQGELPIYSSTYLLIHPSPGLELPVPAQSPGSSRQ